MKKIYRIVNIARSGGHAIANWLYDQFPCEKKDLIKFKDYVHIVNNQNGINVIFDRYENSNIHFVHRTKARYKDLEIPDIDERESIYILILRDPFNLFASRSHNRDMRKENRQQIDKVKDRWKEHAKEFLCDTNNYKNKICISYNEWFSNVEYRKSLSKKIGGVFSDLLINIMTNEGRGSSFSDRNNQHLRQHAQELDTANRWRIFFKDDRYNVYKNKVLPIFKDKELISLSKRVFGNIEGTEKLYE